MSPTPFLPASRAVRGAVAAAVLLAAPLRAQPTAPRTLSLEDALALAGTTSEAVGIARAGVTRARGQQWQARSALLPQVTTSVNYQRQLQNQFQAISERFAPAGDPGNGGPPSDSAGGGDGFTDSPIARIFASPYTVTFTAQASQNVFDGGRALAGTRAARAQRTVAEIGVNTAEAQLQVDVTEAYYDAVLSERLVAIAESSFVQAERTLRQVALTYDVGNTSEFELLRARVTRDNQRPPMLQARTQRTAAYLRLKQLLDLPLDEALALTSPIVEAPVTAPSRTIPVTSVAVDADVALAADPRVRTAVDSVVALADTVADQRLAVKQAEQALEASRQQYRAARASRWPSLFLSTTYQRFAYPEDGVPRGLNDFFPNWTVGGGISLPLFTGGRVSGEIMAAEAAYEEQRYRLAQAREAAALESRLQVEQLEAAQAGWLASVGTADVARRAYEIAEVRFREGLSTQVELSEARVQWQQALANRAQAARDLQVARVRLALLRSLPLGAAAGAAGSMAAPTAAGAQAGAAVNRTPTNPAAGPAGATTQPGQTGGGTT